jgi:Asp-tRNA(Asn)/Glu-tRNA(Gln) amidotransferase A subunit family amidase
MPSSAKLAASIRRPSSGFCIRCTVALSPVAAQPPEPLGTSDMTSDKAEAFVDNLFHLLCFTRQLNVTGGPAVAIPLHWTAEGLPIGVQFAAYFGNEALLFRLAAQLEQAKLWRERRASLSTKWPGQTMTRPNGPVIFR